MSFTFILLLFDLAKYSFFAIEQQRLCVQLKVTKGPHMGQRFQLELPVGKMEGDFKIGRSNGRAFKERGVSLYKDNETSSSHAKVRGVRS